MFSPENYSARIAVSTSAACPLGVTLSQMARIFPSGPIQYVIRTIPRNDFPRKLFIRRAPYGSITSNSVSASSGKVSLCFVLNFFCDSTESPLQPTIAVFSSSNCLRASRNSDASLIQPGVFAFG
jgi:hypothetical protein